MRLAREREGGVVGKEAGHPGWASSPGPYHTGTPGSSEDNGEPLTGSKRETDVVQFAFQNNCSYC